MPELPTPEQVSAYMSAAAHASWARTTDRRARLAATWAGRDRRIAREYGIPDELEQSDPGEYARRLESAKRAYFKQMAANREAKRRARKAASTSDRQARGDAA
ncbi:hypothetical protein GCM10009676_00470 [Prauserella halophila]|uniref:Uncharacterized protein n=1 Tax=Prauserella halophila TaxID=185641 RepID=A0ABP4GHG4_9PSEU|nr:hypothetical protein [Prauserella halophila]MCP2234609.1 hypothetical protein [Prauserella halophila]